MNGGGRTDAGRMDRLPPAVRQVVDLVEDRKGYDIVVLDVREVASFTDYMMICTGRGERHVQAIVDAILEGANGQKPEPLHTEGYEQAHWVLVDFVDYLVNVFTPETRDFYQLERLWRDAPVLVGEGLEATEGEEPTEVTDAAARGDDADEDSSGPPSAAAEAGDG